MPKKKIIVAGCVFSAMFGGAWVVDEKINREYVEQIGLEDSTLQLSASQTEAPFDTVTKETTGMEKFKPREYVRVVSR